MFRNIFDRMRGLGREDGQAMVEFALVVPILLTIVLAGIQFGTVYLQWQQLSSATSEGARRAVVSRRYDDRETRIETAVVNAAPSLEDDITVDSIVSDWTPGSPVTVTASYPIVVNILGMHVVDKRITNSRTMRVEQ